MTNEERIKSILAEIEYDYIGYGNLHNDGSQGLRLIKKALEKYLQGRVYICEDCGRELDISRGDVQCSFCQGVVRSAEVCAICGNTVREKGKTYCEDCREAFLGKVVKPTELYLLNRMSDAENQVESSVENVLKAKFMLSDCEYGCVLCGKEANTPLCDACNNRLNEIIIDAADKMYCYSEEIKGLAEDYYRE